MTTAVRDTLVPGDGTVDDAVAWLRDADRVLIGAGAGLSAAAGYDYADRERFAQLFPALHAAGFTARYELIGYPLPPSHQWGFWAVHTTDVRFSPAPSPLYADLRHLIGDRDHFVLTSNVDQLFSRSGFDPDRMYTPQGDYGLYQCLTPCSREVWASDEIIARALDAYDAETGTTAAVPSCPNCAGPVSLNVFAGRWFINDHFQPGGHRLRSWLADAATRHERVVALEFGAGFNTPGVVRWPMEQVTQLPGARLIRVNPDFAGVPQSLATVSASLSHDAATAISELHR